jgi:hypothetical protein
LPQSGLVIFKLERERPAMDVNVLGSGMSSSSSSAPVSRQLFYFKERYIRMWDQKSGKDIPITAVRTLSPKSISEIFSFSLSPIFTDTDTFGTFINHINFLDF